MPTERQQDPGHNGPISRRGLLAGVGAGAAGAVALGAASGPGTASAAPTGGLSPLVIPPGHQVDRTSVGNVEQPITVYEKTGYGPLVEPTIPVTPTVGNDLGELDGNVRTFKVTAEVFQQQITRARRSASK